MTNREQSNILKGGAVLGIACLTIGLAGCSGGNDQASVDRAPRRAAPSASQAPQVSRVTSVADLMEQLGIDKRVELPEEKAPGTTEQRKAVLEFFDAFARGDSSTLSSMLTTADQYELQQLVESGEWQSSTSGIDSIMVQTGKSPEGLDCALAIIEIGDNYQPQMWYYNQESGGFVFDAASTPPNMMDRLYGMNPIKVWHDILAEELELATKPDEQPEEIQVVVDQGSRRGGGRQRGAEGPTSLNPGPGAPITAPGKGIPGPSPGGG